MKKYRSENAIKCAMNVLSFDQLSPDQYDQLAGIIPDADPNVAASVINQIQSFTDFGKAAMSNYMQMCDHFLEQNKQSQSEAIRSYQMILDGLLKRLESENINEDERKAITKDMIEVANNVAKLDENNKLFLEKMGKLALTGLVVLVGGILGGKFLSPNDEQPEIIDSSHHRPRFFK